MNIFLFFFFHTFLLYVYKFFQPIHTRTASREGDMKFTDNSSVRLITMQRGTGGMGAYILPCADKIRSKEIEKKKKITWQLYYTKCYYYYFLFINVLIWFFFPSLCRAFLLWFWAKSYPLLVGGLFLRFSGKCDNSFGTRCSRYQPLEQMARYKSENLSSKLVQKLESLGLLHSHRTKDQWNKTWFVLYFFHFIFQFQSALVGCWRRMQSA